MIHFVVKKKMGGNLSVHMRAPVCRPQPCSSINSEILTPAQHMQPILMVTSL
jgi:hypothetical protein